MEKQPTGRFHESSSQTPLLVLTAASNAKTPDILPATLKPGRFTHCPKPPRIYLLLGAYPPAAATRLCRPAPRRPR